jgi:hypothetical protein
MMQSISKRSAIGIALLAFIAFAIPAQSLPLTETIYMIPENEVEVFFRDEVCDTGKYNRKDSMGLGFGATDYFSLWVQFDLLSQNAFDAKKADIGDILLKARFFFGDYIHNQIHLGFLSNVRFPSGKNAYAGSDWRNLALGKYELKVGPFCRFDILKTVFVHLNLFYTFREANGEDFWGGFYINIFKEDTWKKAFGFNPAEKGTFLNVNRLKNDFAAASMAWNTNVLYPFIPFIEIYASFRTMKGKIDTQSVPIEAAKYNVFLLSAGLRYFIMNAIYLGIYSVQNPFRKQQPGVLQARYGIEISLQL